MDCPKCKQTVADQSSSCPHCGIVFAKYLKYHTAQKSESQESKSQNPEPPTVIIYQGDEVEKHWLTQLLLNDSRQNQFVYLIPRAIVWVCFVIWSFRLIAPSIESNAVGESFLHMINLPFHEAGHIFFRPFGQFITSLGGTLGQLIMPLICMLTLLIKTRDPFGAALAFWWFGENFLDIAPYINDARAGELPLLGGNFGHSSPYGFHDWEYLLTESGFIEHDHVIAKMSFATGIVLMLLALLWNGVLLFRMYQSRNMD